MFTQRHVPATTSLYYKRDEGRYDGVNIMPTWLIPEGFDAFRSLDLNKDEMNVYLSCVGVLDVALLMEFLGRGSFRK